jgi:hypothetical protein
VCRYALDVVTSKGDRFVRPVVWEVDHPAPPAELAHLHFARLDVSALGKVPSALVAAASPLGVAVPVPLSRLQMRPTAAVLVMLLILLFAVFVLFH